MMNKSALAPAAAAMAALAALLAAGCTLAPTYQRPAAPVASGFGNSLIRADASAAGEKAAAKLPWKSYFTDARLQALIELALANNRDLRVAALNIEQAQAQYRISRADLLPTINAAGSGTRARTPADVSVTRSTTLSTSYSAGLSVTAFELDLFGRVRSGANAAMASYLATEAAQRAVRLSLITEVVKAYLNTRALREQLELSQRTLASREEGYKLLKLRFDNGASSALDLQQAETLMYQARGDVASLTRSAAQAENALVLLLGAPVPANLPAETSLEKLHLSADIPAGLPSELLENRPDIIQAEYQLQAANANIGAARAAFFPRVLITGSDGVASASFSQLFSAPQLAWSFAPSITLPIFDLGRNFANLDVADARKNIGVAQYEKAIQTAFREVADALAGRATLDDQLAAAEGQARSETERRKLVEQRFANGIGSALDRLDAERSAYAAQQTLLQVRASRLINRADLYKALGGGQL